MSSLFVMSSSSSCISAYIHSYKRIQGAQGANMYLISMIWVRFRAKLHEPVNLVVLPSNKSIQADSDVHMSARQFILLGRQHRFGGFFC